MAGVVHLTADGVELWFGGADTPVPPDPPATTAAPQFTVAVLGFQPGDRVAERQFSNGW
jgi:hypothetical protein